MAFNQRIALEVDAATGDDTNGGGFDDFTGVPGTNYAWGAAQQVFTYTDLQILGTNTQIQSALQPFSAAKVGNIINISGGVGFTVGRYQVLSVSGVTATLDRAVGTALSVNGTGKLGGAFATIQAAMDAAWITAATRVADCRVYVKKGAYTGTVALTVAGAVSSQLRARLLGYYQNHDDWPLPSSGNIPTYAVGSGAGVNGFNGSVGMGLYVWGLGLVGTASGGTAGVLGVNATANFYTFAACKITGFSSSAFKSTVSYNCLLGCEVTACGGAAGTVDYSAGVLGAVNYCWIHKNTGPGIAAGAGFTIIGNLITNNSGASSDGIRTSYNNTILHNTIYGNGRDGIRTTAAYDTAIGAAWCNNVIGKNGGVGINQTSAGSPPTLWPSIDYNFFYSNTGGNYTNHTAGAHDVAVTVNPFVSSDVDLAAETAPDWTLNTTLLAGASLRSAGFPGALPGMTSPLGYADPGAYQARPLTFSGGILSGGRL
jgi:hypothetical protein